jgi:O-antigen ligase
VIKSLPIQYAQGQKYRNNTKNGGHFILLSSESRYLENTLFILLFAWISFFPQPIHDQYAVYAKIFLGVILGVLVLDSSNRKNLFSLKDWPLWVFLLSILPGAVNATNKTIALKTYLYLSTNFFLVYYIGRILTRPWKNINSLNVTICMSSIIVSLVGFFESIYGFNPIYKYFIHNPFYQRYIEGVVRPMSTLFNPAPLATYLLFTWPFAILLCRRKNSLGYATIILSIACLIMTFSRGSFLGLIFIGLFYLFLSKRYKDLLIMGMFVLIILIVAQFLPYPFCRFSLRGLGISGTGILSDYRIIRTQMSLEMLKNHPLFGVGLNNFRVLFDNFYPLKSHLHYIDYEVKIPDNMYLTLLAETGMAGLTGFLIFTASLIYRSLRKLKGIKNEDRKQFLLISICVLTGILCSMGGYELFYWSSPYLLFCLICGFISSAASD